MESNYTKVPNSIFDIEGLTVYERLILLYIVRKTIGYNKKSDGISLSQFVNFTGSSKSTVLRAIESLKEQKMIKVQHQTHKSGGKHFNRYIPLVSEVDHLVSERNKGSITQTPPLVSEVDIQKKTKTKENKQKKREGEMITTNIYFSLQHNEQLREVDKYIDHLIDETEYIKSESAFRMKIKRQIGKEDKHQLEDFEKWYLEKTCRKYTSNFEGKFINDFRIVNIYPYFDTKGYDDQNKFIVMVEDTELFGEAYTYCFDTKTKLDEYLEGAVNGTL